MTPKDQYINTAMRLAIDYGNALIETAAGRQKEQDVWNAAQALEDHLREGLDKLLKASWIDGAHANDRARK